jgi:hypothetical protein
MTGEKRDGLGGGAFLILLWNADRFWRVQQTPGLLRNPFPEAIRVDGETKIHEALKNHKH